jgi:hypothetical protein
MRGSLLPVPGVVKRPLDLDAYNAYTGAAIEEEVRMAILNIRNLPDHVHRKLRVRAASAGRSMEAEARWILEQVCSGVDIPEQDSRSLPEWVSDLYGGHPPLGVVEGLLAQRREEAHRE